MRNKQHRSWRWLYFLQFLLFLLDISFFLNSGNQTFTFHSQFCSSIWLESYSSDEVKGECIISVQKYWVLINRVCLLVRLLTNRLLWRYQKNLVTDLRKVSKQDTAEKICQNVFQLHVESALNNQPLVGDKTCKKVLTGHFSVEKIRSIACSKN